MIGPHIINDKANLSLLQKWNPPVITLLDPNPDYLVKVRNAVPDAKLLVRIYIPDNEVSDGIKTNPVAYAKYSHDLTIQKYGHVLTSIDYVQIANEVLQHNEELTLLANYELERMRLADASKLYKCGIFAFSVGNPDVPNWELYLSGALEYADKYNHVVVVHQYSKPPSMWTPGPDWHIHRLEHKVLPLLSNYTSLKYIVAEYGLDDLLYGNGTKGGYKKFISAEEYANQLINIGSYIYQFSDKVLGYCIFTLGTGSSDWITYDISGEVEGILAAYYEQNKVLPKWRNNTTMTKYKVRITANAGLNVRSKPNTTAQIVETLLSNTIVEVTDYNSEWLKYNSGYIFKAYTSSNLTVSTNDKLAEYAKANELDKYLLQALTNIESGANGFQNGRLLIRVEAHLLLSAAPELSQFFSYNPNNRFFDHFFNGQKYHGNQDKEWQAFDFARRKHALATYNSTSYGKFQILGSNYASLGFNSAEDMFNYLSANEDNHYTVFFRYLENFNLLQPIQNKDFVAITSIYNGPGNVAHYSKLLEQEYNRIKPKGDIIEVPVEILEPIIIEDEKEPDVTEQQYNELLELVINNSNTINTILAVINKLSLRLDSLEAYILSEPDKEPVEPEKPPIKPSNVDVGTGLKEFFDKGIFKVKQGNEFKLVEVFSIQDGSWDVSSKRFSIDQRFRDKWLRPTNSPEYIGSGDHALSVLVEDKDGNRLENVPITFKSNGEPPLIVNRVTKQGSGYENLELYSGQNFSETSGGPWSVIVGDFEFSGGGMYSNHHISTILIIQKQ
jgi:hypothetical protein